MHYQYFNPELFVDSCYLRKAYRKYYENTVSPINDMDMSSNVNIDDKLPPHYKKGPYMLKKLRFREHDEIR